MNIEKHGSSIWIYFSNILVFAGVGKRFALGFAIDKYMIDIDFLCFYIGVER